jgi:hypothetical protein
MTGFYEGNTVFLGLNALLCSYGITCNGMYEKLSTVIIFILLIFNGFTVYNFFILFLGT